MRNSIVFCPVTRCYSLDDYGLVNRSENLKSHTPSEEGFVNYFCTYKEVECS